MNAEQIAHVMSLVDEFAFVAGLCGVDHARDGNSNGRKAEFNDARQRVEDAIAALSAEGGADSGISGHINGYLPRAQAVEFRADTPLPEWVTGAVGVRAFLSPRPAAAATGDMVLVPREPNGRMWIVGRAEFIRKAQDYEDARSSEKQSVIADVAGSEIYRAMIAAAQQEPAPYQEEEQVCDCGHPEAEWSRRQHSADCGLHNTAED